MTSLPKTARRVYYTPDRTIEIEEFELNALKPDEVLIETICTLISAGTELGHRYSSDKQYRPGYSNVGRIIAMGDEAKESDYSEGDLVVTLSGHATHAIVSTQTKAHRIAKVPEGVDPHQAAFTVLGSVSIHGVHRAKVELGEHVLVSGVGLVGQLALQFLSLMGCESLIAVDFEPFRLETALKLGATHAVNPKETNIKDFIWDLTKKRGVDVTIEASGFPEALVGAFELSRVGGRIMGLGSAWNRKIEVDFTTFLERELQLMGCHQPKCPTTRSPYYTWTQQHNRQHILKMIADGRLDTASLITHRIPLENAEEGYRLLRDEKDKALGVILTYDGV